MSLVGIFIFGLFITGIVTAACGLIVYGLVTERREREELGESRTTEGSE